MKRSYEKFTARLDEIGLRARINSMAISQNVSLRNLYESGPSPSVTAARRHVYRKLIEMGKGSNEIARLFDRAPSGVAKMVKA